MFSVYVDSDSLPVKQREILLRRLRKENIPSYFVADKDVKDVLKTIEEHTADLRRPLRATMDKDELRNVKSTIHFVKVQTGANSADDYLVEIGTVPGLGITHDIPLAERLIEKGLRVMDDRGNEYDKSNIRERMSERAYMADFREMGLYVSAQKKFSQKDVENFSNTLDRIMRELSK